MKEKLVSYLQKCDEAYYNSSNPLVSDETYDAMVETLRRIAPEHPYLTKVGVKVESNKIGRVIPMGTLSKVYTNEEVAKWLASESGEVLLSPKYDGFAVELTYLRGELISASTRGDGYVGEDVLPAVLRMLSIPVKLTHYVSDITIIRGEAIIPIQHHDKLKKLGYTAMRNAVPGIVKSVRVDALQYVDYVAYEFIDGNTDRVAQRAYYSRMFYTEDYREFRNTEEFDYILYAKQAFRSYCRYEIDGVVLKTRFIKEDDLLNPNHMIAWKYRSNRATTYLRGIEYQLGVTGYFTPIGIFDPVEFQGAILTRASLGNMTRLAKDFNGLTIDSLIEVSRRGDIIPYIESMVMKDPLGEWVAPLRVCPHCGCSLEMDNLEPHCVNKKCPEKLRLQISQYVRSVGIKGIGDKLVRSLIDAGYLSSITDIYHIDPECILTLPHQGKSSVEKWKLLCEKKLSPLELLTAYPFLDLGKKVWETVLSKFSMDEILNMTKEKLASANLKGIGESKMNSIVSQLADNKTELLDLMNMNF